MKYNPVQLIPKRTVELDSILSNALNADINIRDDGLPRLRERESDDVRVSIMVQMGPVYFKEVFIRTEDVIYLINRRAFVASQRIQENLQYTTAFERKGLVHIVKPD